MKIIGNYIKKWVLHPFLLILYPILFLYSHNINELSISVLVLPMVIAWVGALSIYLLFTLLIKDKYKRGVFLSLLIFITFSYSHVLKLIALPEKNPLFLIFYLAGFGMAAFFILKSGRKFQHTNTILNVTAIFLLLFTLVNIITHEIRFRLNKFPDPKQYYIKLESNPPPEPGSFPDIYYLIFDRYGSSQLLADSFQYDNSPFEKFLQEKGFFIASQSKANYPYTFLSLASSLNLRYLDFLRPITGQTSDKTVVYQMIKDSTVVNFLKSKGYKFYNFGSWWQPSRRHPLADENILLNGFKPFNIRINEFSEKLLKTTLIYHLFTDLLKISLIESDLDIKRILFQFNELEKIATREGPKFIFSHSLSTHPPFYFDSQGNIIARQELAGRSQKALYGKSIAFTNNRLRKIVNAILSNSKRPAVIIIQADEGPWADILGDPKVSRKVFRRSKMRASIFNAYFVSPECILKLYEYISPVNTFRIIFNHYFNTTLPLLEDRVFLTLRERDLYHFTEITHRLIYGTIVVKNLSHPVRIFLDGEEVTPVDRNKIRNVKPGIHAIKILKEGFEPWQIQVKVKPGRQTKISMDLAKMAK